MGNTTTRTIFRGLSGLIAVLAAVPVLAAWELNMPQGVTESSREIYSLHMLILYVCVVIGVLVFGAMIYSMIRHRKSVHPVPATFSHSTIAETIWGTIPVFILIAMAYPAAKTLLKLEDASGSDMTVQVTGNQWNWHYEYPEEGIEFYSRLSEDANIARQPGSGIDPATVPNYLRDVDNPLVVPVGKKVRLLLTAADVIHAWWVPELTGKRDAIPGFVNSLWFRADRAGTYRGQCAELCGRDHGFMPIVVKAVSEADYNTWVSTWTGSASSAAAPGAVTRAAVTPAETSAAAPSASPAVTVVSIPVATEAAGTDMNSLMITGEAIYKRQCIACHQANGEGMPPAFPALTGGAVTTGPIAGHINNVVNGVTGTAMIGFGALLSDEEIAAVVTYERNALGNSVGDMATPALVASQRAN